MNRSCTLILGLLSGIFIIGCSIPQPALDTAELGSEMALKTSRQLENLQDTQQAVISRREERLTFLRQQQAKTDATVQRKLEIEKAAGGRSSLKIIDSITALSALDAQNEQTRPLESTAATAISDGMAPLGKASAALSKVSAELTPLSKQRTNQERASIAVEFAKSVRAQIDAADDAQAKASNTAKSSANALAQ